MKNDHDLYNQLEKQAKRIKKAEREQTSLLAQTTYIGTLGLLLVIPIIASAYLGNWLDKLSPGYSIQWTISLILLGLLIGIFNVYLFIKQRE